MHSVTSSTSGRRESGRSSSEKGSTDGSSLWSGSGFGQSCITLVRVEAKSVSCRGGSVRELALPLEEGVGGPSNKSRTSRHSLPAQLSCWHLNPNPSGY